MDSFQVDTSTEVRSRPFVRATVAADVAVAVPFVAVCDRPSGVSVPTALGWAD